MGNLEFFYLKVQTKIILIPKQKKLMQSYNTLTLNCDPCRAGSQYWPGMMRTLRF